MAYFDTTWYVNAGDQLTTGVSTTGYWAVARRPQNAVVAAGALVRQFTTPSTSDSALNSERVFVCIVAGTTANTVDAAWPAPPSLNRGVKVTDGTVVWQECTGTAAVNGDFTNTPDWAIVKHKAVSIGQIIKRSNGASYQICSTAGTTGNAAEPGFSNTAGITTADGTAVWTSIGPVGSFTHGGAPHARLAAALATGWFLDGNTIYVANTSAEWAPGQNQITGGASNINVGRIICHRQTGSYPPTADDITTGASINITANLSSLYFMPEGHYYVYGIHFRSSRYGLIIGGSSSHGGPNWYYFDTCSFELFSNVIGGLNLGRSGSAVTCTVYFDNTTVKFHGVAADCMMTLGHTQFFWFNTPQILTSDSVLPGALFQPFPFGSCNAMATLEGLDLSQVATILFSDVGLSADAGYLLLKDCKLHSDMTVTPPSYGGFVVQLTRCGSTVQGRYRSERYAVEGVETTEDVITRVDGAVDPAGQRQSRKTVTSAMAQWIRPFQAEPFALWFAPTGFAPTITIYGATIGALPANDEIWLEIEYLGSADSPQGTIFKTTKANLWAVGTPLAMDSSVWNSGGSLTKFKLVALLPTPPQLAGYMHVRVRAAKASMTYYIDPQVFLG